MPTKERFDREKEELEKLFTGDDEKKIEEPNTTDPEKTVKEDLVI